MIRITYQFHYDILNDYETAYQTVFSKVQIEQYQLDKVFWPGEMIEWFETCNANVFGQHIKNGEWKFSFVDKDDAEAFHERMQKKRSHGFVLTCPMNISIENYEKLVFKWLNENVTGMLTCKRGAGVVEIEIRDEVDAVKAKMLLSEIHEADQT